MTAQPSVNDPAAGLLAEVAAGSAVAQLLHARVGGVLVADLEHHDRDRRVAARVDGGHRGPVAEPGLDVVGVGDAVALLADAGLVQIALRTSSSVSSPMSSRNDGNLRSIRTASIFCDPHGSRSMLA